MKIFIQFIITSYVSLHYQNILLHYYMIIAIIHQYLYIIILYTHREKIRIDKTVRMSDYFV